MLSFITFPLDEKLTNENQDSATADICIKNAADFSITLKKNKLATNLCLNFQQ
jgi:hypothetical protein